MDKVSRGPLANWELVSAETLLALSLSLSLSLSHLLSLSSSPVRIHYNLLSDKKAKTPITGEKLNFQFLLGITLAVGLSRLQRKTFSQERWGRPHSFSLGMREQERQNLWCAHWKTDCIMEWAVRIGPAVSWEIREQFLFHIWWRGPEKNLFTNPNRNKAWGQEVSPAFCRPCIMACLKKDNGRRC